MRQRVGVRPGWDWWQTMRWPPMLAEFDPADWPAPSVPESWRLFCEARRAAPPKGWRLAAVRALTGDRS